MMNKKILKAVAVLGVLFLLTGCTPAAVEVVETTTNNIATGELFGTYADEDLDATWDDATATHITLKQDAITIDGEGAKTSGSTLTITTAGTYVLTGSLTNGQVVVSAEKTDLVRIIFNGVEIHNESSAAVSVEQAKKAIITLAEGTKNTVSDGTNYVFADAATDEPNATIFSKDDLTINGAGNLTVKAAYQSGIISKDTMIITGGTYDITANDNGIRGRDTLSILTGTFTLNVKNDGLQSNNDTDATKGILNLDGGTYNITAAHDGIQADNALNISNGTYTITSGGGSNQTVNSSDTESYKGLKATNSIVTTGGTFTIDALDDSVHTNGTIDIKGGNFSLATGDDGMHADSTLNISGGDIAISKSYEGLEAANINISGGTSSVVSSDDGVNAAGGSDGTTEGGAFGGDQFSGGGDYSLNITGGTLIVNADGDGLDSNGAITMSGGVVLVDGPTDNGNGALDYDGTFDITGGTLIAAGSTGMAQAPSDTSSQASLSFYFTSGQQGGQTINLSSSDGKNIVTYTPSKNFQNIIISTPELKDGSAYTISTGGSDTGTSVGGLKTGGTYSNGNQISTVTLSGSVTGISETGEAVQTGGMGGGPGGMGGAQPGGRP